MSLFVGIKFNQINKKNNNSFLLFFLTSDQFWIKVKIELIYLLCNAHERIKIPTSKPHIIIANRISRQVSNRRSLDSRLKRARSLQ